MNTYYILSTDFSVVVTEVSKANWIPALLQ